jgi:hypothetical protein
MEKGKPYRVKPGFSVHTRKGLVRAGGIVYEKDFEPGHWDKVKRKLVDLEPDEMPPEPPPKPEPKAAKKKTSTKSTAKKKAAEKKSSFDFGRKED